MATTSTKHPPVKTDAVRSDALATLGSLDHGHLPCRLAEKFETIIKAVSETGKKGRLTLDLHIERVPKLGPNAVQIIVDLDRSKIPVSSPEAQIRFATETGQLVTDDPRQLKFRFQSTDPDDKPTPE